MNRRYHFWIKSFRSLSINSPDSKLKFPACRSLSLLYHVLPEFLAAATCVRGLQSAFVLLFPRIKDYGEN